MNVVPIAVARVSNQMRDSMLLNTLQGGQVDMLKVEQQLSSGQQLSLPSDDPAAAMSIQQLRAQLSDNAQGQKNLDYANGFVLGADGALATVKSTLDQATGVASDTISTLTTADERQEQATVIDGYLNTMIAQANTRYQNAAVFGGANGTVDPFVAVNGGYKYQGSTTQQSILTPGGQPLPYTVDGNAIFGGLSAQVKGYQDLDPALTANTRLADLGGTTGKGVTGGPIGITDGTNGVVVDLSTAATVGDAVNTIQSALTTAGINASVAISGNHLQITNSSGSAAVTFNDIGSGTAAAHLGLAGTMAPSTVSNGASVEPALTATTPLSALRGGAGIDPSGILITNGQLSATVTTSGLATVQDFLNAINSSGTQVRAQINSAGTGIDVLNSLSGSALQIGENGGNTAQELGIRSFQPNTLLSDLNGGQGVTPISGTVPGPSGDITVTRTDGSTFSVSMSGVKSPTDIINAINNAPGNSNPATKVTATPNATGNGLTLTDISGGAGNLSVAPNANFLSNGSTLGIFSTASGAVLAGSDVTLNTDDVRITRRDGTSFTVNFSGLGTVQDVLNAINNAAGNTNPATQVAASLNTQGNGITLTDPTAGGGALTVAAINASPAAKQLGILKTAASGTPGVVTGDDVDGVAPRGIFSSLTMLRNALNANDTAGIQQAATLLAQDTQRVIRFQGQVGARLQEISDRKDQASSDQISLTQSLSLVADTDMTTAITRFQSLQTAYQGSLQVAQATQNLSLLNFLK